MTEELARNPPRSGHRGTLTGTNIQELEWVYSVIYGSLKAGSRYIWLAESRYFGKYVRVQRSFFNTGLNENKGSFLSFVEWNGTTTTLIKFIISQHINAQYPPSISAMLAWGNKKTAKSSCDRPRDTCLLI